MPADDCCVNDGSESGSEARVVVIAAANVIATAVAMEGSYAISGISRWLKA